MSTSLAGAAPHIVTNVSPDTRVAIVAARWNGHITGALTDGALDVLHKAGLKPENTPVLHVPGTVELTYAAAALAADTDIDAVIVIGCVIRGGTPHFDYVCQSVTQGITSLNARGEVPVIFGVLTVDCEQDALDRAGGCLGNKGSEAAEAALDMINFTRRVLAEEYKKA